MSGRKCYIGVMSGTSLDGVDAVLCPVGEDGAELAASLEYPFDPQLREEILRMIGGTATLEGVGELDRRLGELFADAVEMLIERYALDRGRIEAVGLHGQTLWHRPQGAHPFTMQLGDPNVVAARTGIRVAADFRRKDIALGGQGAPFAPAFHRFVFGTLKGKTAVLNLGGMANLTVLDEPLTGYDTGPGNVLIDGVMREAFGREYDRDGEVARAAEVDEELLARMLGDPYFSTVPPKSTGREYFNAAWTARRLSGNETPETLVATLTELTAATAAGEAAKYAPDRLLLCGGGAKNAYLVRRIRAFLPGVEVEATDAYGIPGDWMEAMAFAWLAYMRLNRKKVPLSSVTGAKHDTVLGGLYE